MITLYHHPFSRAAGVVWALEEIGQPYKLEFVDLMKGAHKQPAIVGLNPMGKLPILVDGDTVITEGAAIDLYLADRYAPGTLAPALDDPRRGPYLRWSFFAPSVIEPGLMAKQAGWDYKPGQAGWGDHPSILSAIDKAVERGPYLLGDQFTMADVIFGGNLRFVLQFGMLEKRPAYTGYVERLSQRDAYKRADARNAQVMQEHGIKLPGQS